MPAKLVVAPAMSALNKICKFVDVEQLDQQEQASGIQAFAALAYHYWGEMSPWYMVAIWLLSVAAPRIGEYTTEDAQLRRALRAEETKQKVEELKRKRSDAVLRASEAGVPLPAHPT